MFNKTRKQADSLCIYYSIIAQYNNQYIFNVNIYLYLLILFFESTLVTLNAPNKFVL